MLKKTLIPGLALIMLFNGAACNKKVANVPVTPQENSAIAVTSQQPLAPESSQASDMHASLTDTSPAMEGATAKPAAPVPVWPFVNDTEEPYGLVYFDYDKFDLTPEAKNTLAKLVPILKNFPDKKVLIEGHCDERGTVEYNLALGERRAYSVKTYLIQAGIQPERLQTISYGKEKPCDPGHTEEAWSKNRRAALLTIQ
jgi:peptidoglycan-associated lipoprotein